MSRVTTASNPDVYYRDRLFLVTVAKVKSPRKTYRVDKIEKVSVRRDPFFIMIGFCALYALFLWKFGWIFRETGPFIFLYVCIVLTYIAKQFSLLFITSKAVSELAFIGLNKRMELVREGIERAMYKEDRDDGLADDDEEEAKDDDDD